MDNKSLLSELYDAYKQRSTIDNEDNQKDKNILSSKALENIVESFAQTLPAEKRTPEATYQFLDFVVAVDTMEKRISNLSDNVGGFVGVAGTVIGVGILGYEWAGWYGAIGLNIMPGSFAHVLSYFVGCAIGQPTLRHLSKKKLLENYANRLDRLEHVSYLNGVSVQDTLLDARLALDSGDESMKCKARENIEKVVDTYYPEAKKQLPFKK